MSVISVEKPLKMRTMNISEPGEKQIFGCIGGVYQREGDEYCMSEKYDNDELRKAFMDKVVSTLETLYSEAETDGEKALMCVIVGTIKDNIEFMDE